MIPFDKIRWRCKPGVQPFIKSFSGTLSLSAEISVPDDMYKRHPDLESDIKVEIYQRILDLLYGDIRRDLYLLSREIRWLKVEPGDWSQQEVIVNKLEELIRRMEGRDEI